MNTILTRFLLICFFFIGCSQEKSLAPIDLVDPFIGTGGHGHTFPGAVVPFGMMQLSPDTRLEGWDGCSGYHNSDSVIYGFSHTHLSGTGIPDYGDILLMPFTGGIHWDNGYPDNTQNGYGSYFKKETEKASPGYYGVTLQDDNIKVELTASERCGMHHYEFLKNDPAQILIDLTHRDQVINSGLNILSDSTLSGFRISKAWAEYQPIYFYLEFSEPFLNYQASINGELSKESKLENTSIKAVFEFKGKDIQVKIGISPVSIEGAKQNLDKEIPAWDFELLHLQARDKWNLVFDKIEVKGGSKKDRTCFYTALYHAFIHPSLFSDVDGKYIGMDGEIYESTENRYTVFSMWDTFRAEHPLFTLLEQKRSNEFVNTLLDQYQKGGTLPIWELWGNYTSCMIGNHAIPIIHDAYVKGITDFDQELALEAMQKSAGMDRWGLDSYNSIGFVDATRESESVSKTLEYAYNNWNIADFAKRLGEDETARIHLKKAQHYKNLYDPESKFMRARNNGAWQQLNFQPEEVNFNYTEANAWHYALFVPQDIEGLRTLLGGKKALEDWLDNLFNASSETSGRDQADITGLIGQYAHGNEPSQHMAYLYNYTNHPDKTQKMTRRILTELYADKPDGLAGNEDCGQMSAWYVLSAMGIYSLTPGMPYYAIGSPLFDEVKINLENGKSFTISAKNNSSENIYIQTATLNGNQYENAFIDHEVMLKGGSLNFEIGPKPSDWGSNSDARYTPSIKTDLLTPAPIIIGTDQVFKDYVDVKLICADESAKIFFKTLENDEWELYSKGLQFNKDVILWAKAKAEHAEESYVVSSHFLKRKDDRSVELLTDFENQYAANGDQSLVDQLRGGLDFRTGPWQGYRGDLIAVVDLKKKTSIKKIGLSCLQEIGPWIWFPSKVVFTYSNDGKNFKPLAIVKNNFPDDEDGKFRKVFEQKVNVNVRYIKVQAKNYGTCPDWHPGVGGKAWLFADEIIIE